MNNEAIKVKIKFLEEKKLKAIISLDFGNFIIKGFRVAESQFENMNGKKLWLTPPSYRDGGGHYHPIFFMPDKEAWRSLEKYIWEEYDKQEVVHYKKRMDMPETDIANI